VGIVDLFSRRQKALRGDVKDVYSYDTIPRPLRVQIINLWHNTLGGEAEYREGHSRGTYGTYKFLVETLRHEYGVFHLPLKSSAPRDTYIAEFTNFLLSEEEIDRILDAIELSFKAINHFTRTWEYLHDSNASAHADAVIEELNIRFREHKVGYTFENDEIIRVDSQFLHAEAVKPGLSLLSAPEYAGAQKEFLAAHEHYRHERNKEALNECLKALESVLKTICSNRKWLYDPHAPAKTLIKVVFEKGLIPSFWDSHFSALRSTLESGVPTGRNKLAGHGQGVQVVEVPGHLVGYMLHLTASAIVFLVEAEKALH